MKSSPQSVNTGNAALSITPVYTARVSYGNAFKLPSFNDLYYPGYGNPNLSPERSTSVEGGRCEHVVRYVHGRDLRYARQQPDRVQPGDVLADQHRPRAYSRHRPVVQGTIGRSTPVSVAVGILNPQDETNDSWLNRRPRQTVSLNIDHTWDELHLHALSTGRRCFMAARRSTIRPFDLSAFASDGGAACFVPDHSHLTVSATVSNLFDRQYMTAYGYNTLGRTAFGKVTSRSDGRLRPDSWRSLPFEIAHPIPAPPDA